MSSPVGLGFTTVNEKALEAIKDRKTPIKGTYNDIFPWRESLPGECEPPMPMSTINAVRARLEYIFKHGPEKIFKRHELAAKAFRVALQKMGIELLAESSEAPPCSNVVTVAKYPIGIDVDKITKIMSKRYLTALVPSPYREGVFQLGTVNESQVNPRHILYLITSLGLTFSELGVKLKLEESIREANEIFLELEKSC
jgi:aspartate aminotransferase-like enzyme